MKALSREEIERLLDDHEQVSNAPLIAAAPDVAATALSLFERIAELERQLAHYKSGAPFVMYGHAHDFALEQRDTANRRAEAAEARVAELEAANRIAESDCNDACEHAKELRDECYLEHTRAEAAEARIAELERERDVCIKAWKLADSCTVQERERTAAAEAQVARLGPLLKECADELAEWVEHEYARTRHHPSEERRYQRDIEPVTKASAALGET